MGAVRGGKGGIAYHAILERTQSCYITRNGFALQEQLIYTSRLLPKLDRIYVNSLKPPEFVYIIDVNRSYGSENQLDRIGDKTAHLRGDMRPTRRQKTVTL